MGNLILRLIIMISQIRPILSYDSIVLLVRYYGFRNLGIETDTRRLHVLPLNQTTEIYLSGLLVVFRPYTITHC